MYKKDPLWLRIQTYEMDASNSSFPFSKKLAKENKWTYEFSRKAIEEYKRFVYLCCISPRGASPSEIVDQVWHLHLIYTESYWNEFCPKILQRELHHYPSKGGASETLKYDTLYEDTIALYRQTFNEDPPIEYWSPPRKNVNVLNLNGWNFKTKYTEYLVFFIPIIFNQLLYHKLNPYSLNGEQFLGFFFITICCTAFYLFIRYRESKKVVHAILDDMREQVDAFELAYIVRGKSAFQQMVMVDLIEQNKIELISDSVYLIHKEHVKNTLNPINNFLLEYSDEKIEFEQIMNQAYLQTSILDDKYPILSKGNEIEWIEFLPHLFITVMGGLRIAQGLVNGYPVSKLAFMLIAFVIISIIITGTLRVSARNSNSTRLNENHTYHIQSEAQCLLLISGAASILAIPMFMHLNQRPFFNDRVSDSSSGCGSGCGSGGDGGGCGGGCGGCGGGD